MTRCKAPGCGQEVVWVETRGAGRAMPVDAKPHEDGNVVIDYDAKPVPLATVIARKPQLSALRAAGVPLYVSHFATCPKADQFRRAR